MKTHKVAAMRVGILILIQRLSRSLGTQEAFVLMPWLVLGIGLLTTAAICEQTRRFGAEEHLRIESTLLDNVVDGLASKLQANIATLAAVAGLFNATTRVSRQEFNTFYETVAPNTIQLKGVQGVGFSRWIPGAQLPAFEQRIRQEGFPSFTVRPPGPRANYSAIEFLEPFDWRNQRAFGYDMYAEPVRREAMQRAAQTGNATVSGRVRLVQETNEDLQLGVLIYVPVYTDQSQRPGASQETLRGWAFSPLRMNDVVKSASDIIDNIDLAGTGVLVFDGDKPNAEDLLFDNLKLLNRNELRHPSYQKLNIGGRTWLVGVQLAPRLVGPDGISSAYWINLLLGISTSTVSAVITRMLVAKHLATRQALLVSEAAAQERALASTVFDESGQGIIVSNPEGQILMANNAFTQLTGYRISEIKGQHTSLLKSGHHDNAYYAQMWNDLTKKGFWEGDIWNRVRSGEIRCHHLNISTVRDESLQPRYYVGMLQDVTEHHQAEQAVRYMAHHDILTGLANRSMLMEQLESHLALAKRHGHAVALLYLDLDGFKPVNDRFGHNIGDRVLQLVADRFRNVIRQGDLLCRQGGDEFVVLVPEAGSTEELEGMAWKLVEASRAPFLELDKSIEISASVGVARFPEHGNTCEQLLAAADNAMYAAKRAKTNPVQVSRGSQPQTTTSSGLLQALDDDGHQGQRTGQSNQQGDGHG